MLQTEPFEPGQLSRGAFREVRCAQELEEAPAQHAVLPFGLAAVFQRERFEISDEAFQNGDIDRGDRIDGGKPRFPQELR